MLKIDIVSGFLGAGKTTFIERLLKTKLKDEKVVLIENEYGEVSVDTDILKDTKIEIRELSQGCICCSLVGDFSKSLKTIIDTYNPDRILIEPSGVGKLSDIIKAVAETGLQENVNSLVCLVDAKKAKMYERNFGEFFVDQIESAHTVILSRTDIAKEEVIATAVEIVRKHNDKAVVVTTPINSLSDEDLIKAYEGVHEDLFEGIDLDHLHEDGEECDDPNCCCHHHHHDHDEEEHEHHHHHDEDDDEHEHHHHDHEDHEHGHHHHHHHDHDHDHEGGEVEEYGIGTFVYYRRKAFDLALFDEFVARKWPRDIVRAKGICYFADEPDMCYVFEQAGQQKTVKQAGQWLATMPADQLAELRKNNPQLEKEWDEKLGDRMIKIVFIGQHIKDQKDAIIAELDKTLAL